MILSDTETLDIISEILRRDVAPQVSDQAASDALAMVTDAVNEMWFDTREDFDALMEKASTSPLKEKIAHDEAQFLDRAYIKMVSVSEVVSDLPRLTRRDQGSED